ncbi:hypothetical protein [Haloarchaeobius sp. HME9146]|uniref:hypothetical protein n=1 Tax=Haloarchaeobius sp. HME9146 TaxID=2978732 RepID=UPI0021BF1B46|nr:hypothetical protein [Haloarchaeobius sp. HME9146]MCT9097313.1 hypothetical protein [Haloarchaeobius sp. HME9146]
MRTALQATRVLTLVVVFALVTATAPVTATGGSTAPACQHPDQLTDAAPVLPVNESGNVSILAYGVGPNVTAAEVPDASTASNTVPLGGMLVVRITAPGIGSRVENASVLEEPAPWLRFRWPCGAHSATGGRVVAGSSPDTVYLVYDDTDEWDLIGDEHGKVTIRLELPASWDGVSEDRTVHETVNVTKPQFWIAGGPTLHVPPSADATLEGWYWLDADADIRLTLSKDGDTVVQKTVTPTSEAWETTVDLSGFENGSTLRYRLSHDGVTHDEGSILIDPYLVEPLTVSLDDEGRVGRTTQLSLEVSKHGREDIERTLTYRVVDPSTGETVSSAERTLRLSADGYTKESRTFWFEVPDTPGRYEQVLSFANTTYRQQLVVNPTATSERPSTTTPDLTNHVSDRTTATGTVPEGDLTLADDPGSGEIPGFGVGALVLAWLTMAAYVRIR